MMKSEGFMKTNTIRILLSCSFIGLAHTNNPIALESDTDQRVSWSSDGGSTMNIVGESRILEMNTNVIVTQGSLEIRGAKAIFEYQASSNELTKITVSCRISPPETKITVSCRISPPETFDF